MVHEKRDEKSLIYFKNLKFDTLRKRNVADSLDDDAMEKG
jgi:hypothetical protein